MHRFANMVEFSILRAISIDNCLLIIDNCRGIAFGDAVLWVPVN